MSDEHQREREQTKPVRREQTQKILQATELFRGQREIWIELDGVRYRLRITRRNKLILQK